LQGVPAELESILNCQIRRLNEVIAGFEKMLALPTGSTIQ